MLVQGGSKEVMLINQWSTKEYGVEADSDGSAKCMLINQSEDEGDEVADSDGSLKVVPIHHRKY